MCCQSSSASSFAGRQKKRFGGQARRTNRHNAPSLGRSDCTDDEEGSDEIFRMATILRSGRRWCAGTSNQDPNFQTREDSAIAEIVVFPLSEGQGVRTTCQRDGSSSHDGVSTWQLLAIMILASPSSLSSSSSVAAAASWRLLLRLVPLRLTSTARSRGRI